MQRDSDNAESYEKHHVEKKHGTPQASASKRRKEEKRIQLKKINL